MIDNALKNRYNRHIEERGRGIMIAKVWKKVCLVILIDNRGQYYPAKIILKFSDKQMLALYNVRKPEEVSRLLKGFVKDREPVPVFGLSENGEAQSRDNAADVQSKD